MPCLGLFACNSIKLPKKVLVTSQKNRLSRGPFNLAICSLVLIVSQANTDIDIIISAFPQSELLLSDTLDLC